MFIYFNQSFESLSDRFRNQLFFALRLLLFKDKKGLIEIWIALLQFIQKILHLQILTTQTQYRYATNIRMICIGCKQLTQYGSILARSATSTRP